MVLVNAHCLASDYLFPLSAQEADSQGKRHVDDYTEDPVIYIRVISLDEIQNENVYICHTN